MLEITLTCPECGTPNNVPVSEGATQFTCAHCEAASPISETLEALTRVAQDPLIGAVISECEIVEKVGEGGFGAVYRAIDHNLQRPVALKMMLQSLTSNQEFVQKFIREAITAAALNHPHIVAIHKVGRDEQRGLHYLIMEFLEGETLAEVIEQKGALPVEESVNMVLQAADALATAHEKNIIHRDIKPENIMIDARGNVKITDFGLAKVVNPDMRSTKVVGTPHYMSPEQFEGKAVDGRTDIYSLGVTFYYMLTQAKPYEGTNTVQVIYSILTHDPRPPMEINPGVPEELWTIIRRMIAKDPEERYHGFREVQRDLEGFSERSLRAMVTCPKCEADNPQGRRYCRECGAPLIVECLKCGSEEPAGVRHCGQCGANIALASSMKETVERASRARSRGEVRQALRLYEEILSIEPENETAVNATRELRATVERIDGLRQEAENLISRGNLEEALGRIEEGLADIPSAAELETLRTEIRTKVTIKAVAAHRLVAEEALASHDYVAASVSLRRAHELDPDDPDLEYELREIERKGEELRTALEQARAHFDAQQYDLAYSAARQALELSPDEEVARDIHDRARSYLDSVDALMDQGRRALEEGRYEDAGTAFRSAAEVRPDLDEARELAGQARERLDDFDARVEEARELTAAGDHAAVGALLDDLARERPFDDRLDPIRESCHDAVRRGEREREVEERIAVGRDAEKEGRLEDAVESYEQALALDAGNERAQNLLDKVRQKIEDATGFARLADEHEREGNLAQALAALNRLQSLRPGDAEIDERLRAVGRRRQEAEARVAEAEEALAEQQFDRAEALAAKALELSPRNGRADKVRAEVDRLRATAEKHLDEARNRISGERFDEALASLLRAEESGADEAAVRELRAEAERGRIAVLKSNATRSFRFEDFEGAIRNYDEVLAASQGDEEARTGRKAAARRLRASRRESPFVKFAAAVLLLLGLGGVQMLAVSRPSTASEGDADGAGAPANVSETVVVPREPSEPWESTTRAELADLVRASSWDDLEARATEEQKKFPEAPEVTETLAWVRGMREADGLEETTSRIRALEALSTPSIGPLGEIAAPEQAERLRTLRGSLVQPEEWQKLAREGDLAILLTSVRLAQEHGATSEVTGDLTETIAYVEKLAAAVEKAGSQDPVAAIRDVYAVPRPGSGPLRAAHDDILAARSAEVVERALEQAWQAEVEDRGRAERLYGEIVQVLEEVTAASPSETATRALARANAGLDYVFSMYKGEDSLEKARGFEDFERADEAFGRALEEAGGDPDRSGEREAATRAQLGRLEQGLVDRLLEDWPTTREGFARIVDDELWPLVRLFGLYVRFVRRGSDLGPDEATEEAYRRLGELARK